MVVAHDQADVFPRVDVLQDERSHLGMQSHDFQLSRGQCPGLAQKLVRHRNLADVVEAGAVADGGAKVVGQTQAIRDGR